MSGSTLVKAKLISEDGGGTINFMFNPEKLTIKRQLQTNQAKGARTEKGMPKTTFAHPNPSTLTISNILFDTYETGESVMSHIQQFEKALDFISASEQRPPTYIFTWGNNKYFRCFIEDLTYDLTMFLPDGTPVRAVINSLKLKEVDESVSSNSTGVSNPSSSQRSSR